MKRKSGSLKTKYKDNSNGFELEVDPEKKKSNNVISPIPNQSRRK